MRIAIRYYTRSGNTKKLADAASDALGVEALDITHKLKNDVDILFLGSSVYAAGVDDKVIDFINNIDVKVGCVVNFSTAAILKSTKKQVEKLLNEKSIKIDDREFYCKGSFGPLHKNRPNSKDLESFKKFCLEIVE